MNQHEPSDDANLDAIISRSIAESSCDDRLGLERLEKKWRDGMQKELHAQSRRRWIQASSLAAIAALLLIGLTAIMGRWRAGEEDLPILTENKPTRSISEEPTGDLGISADDVATSREPTSYERIMFAAQSQQTRAPGHVSLSVLIDQVLRREVSSAGLARFDRAIVEQKLRTQFVATERGEQRKMLPLLAEFGGESTISTLLDTVANVPEETKEVRQEILLAIEQIAGVQQWPMLSASIEDRSIQLLISQRLVQLLQDDRLAMRRAAMQAINESFDCDAVDALIDRVARQPSDNQETWFALFACQCPSANAFLSDASRNPRLIGQFNNARLQWSRMITN